jgi:hypothetical protein
MHNGSINVSKINNLKKLYCQIATYRTKYMHLEIISLQIMLHEFLIFFLIKHLFDDFLKMDFERKRCLTSKENRAERAVMCCKGSK